MTPGDIVSFSYENFGNTETEEFLNPIIYRIRTDIYANNINNENTNIQANGNYANMKRSLMDIAKERNLDPLLPETWYSISPADIKLHKVKLIYYY